MPQRTAVTLGRAWFMLAVICALMSSLALAKKPSKDGFTSLKCAVAPGYDFYPYLSITYTDIVGTAPGLQDAGATYNAVNGNNDQVLPAQQTVISNLKSLCDQGSDDENSTAVRCNAFTTGGQLLVAPLPPIFAKLDTTDPDLDYCDGVYVSQSRSLTGFDFDAPELAGTTPESIIQAGAQTTKKLAALKRVADKTRERLVAGGIDPKNARNEPQANIKALLAQDQIPLAKDGLYTTDELYFMVASPATNGYQATNSTSYPYISGIRNQGSCGACVAYAFSAVAEAAMARAMGNVTNTWNMAEQWMFFCNGLYAPTCSTGWSPGAASTVLSTLQDFPEVCYPWSATSSCKVSTSCGGNTSTVAPYNVSIAYKRRFMKYQFTNITKAKEFLANGGTIASYLTVYPDFQKWNRTNGIYKWNGQGTSAGGHQVTVIGFNDNESYWTVKNSWGTGWGEYGYVRIAYNAGVGFMCETCVNNMIGFTFDVSGTPSTRPGICGDGVCNKEESCSLCEDDCGACPVCGDGVCTPLENCNDCPTDCGSCANNGVCDDFAGETCLTAPSDCGTCTTVCGDGYCAYPTEYAINAPVPAGGLSACVKDCGNGQRPKAGYCGDGVCQGFGGYSEQCSSCPADCGTCSNPLGFCGDGTCNIFLGETSASCPRDCSTATTTVPDWLIPVKDAKGRYGNAQNKVGVDGKATCSQKRNNGKPCPGASTLAPPVATMAPSKRKPPPKRRAPPPSKKGHHHPPRKALLL